LDKWIAVDWGTSFFRAYLIKDEKVLCAAKTNDGMKFVQNNNFEKTLVKSIEPWLDNKYKIDMGAITAALEYISDKKAEVFGKPSNLLFNTIKDKFNVSLNEIMIIGDDIEFDVILPIKLGVHGILVKTGKYNRIIEKNIIKKYNIKPEKTISNLYEITKIL
jgi:ribonucleotide monophosphatase NagD (HAD superfamily)